MQIFGVAKFAAAWPTKSGGTRGGRWWETRLNRGNTLAICAKRNRSGATSYLPGNTQVTLKPVTMEPRVNLLLVQVGSALTPASVAIG